MFLFSIKKMLNKSYRTSYQKQKIRPKFFHFIFFTKHELRHFIQHSVKLRNNVKTKCRRNNFIFNLKQKYRKLLTF